MSEFRNRPPGDRLIRKLQLLLSEQRLIELLQSIQFGRVEGLHFANGEPVFDPYPRVIYTRKPGLPDPPRASAQGDYLLKQEWTGLIECIRQIGDGTILLIQV